MKKLINKIIVLLLVFLAVAASIFIYTREEEKEVTADMGEPSLPTVTFLTKDNIEINRTFGYTVSMEKKYMRNSITPLDENRTLSVRVNNLNNIVMGASFELRSLDAERLIEDTEIPVSNITANGEYTDIGIQFDNLMNKDTEYLFILKLRTDRHEMIHFYTRVVILSNDYSKQEIEFANMFSNATFDETTAKNIISYLEPNSTRDNSNLGDVDIHSSFNQITWGNLKPQKVTTPVVTIKEILGTVISLELKYKISAVNDYDTVQYYNVTEFFRINRTNTDIYLLSYKRSMNQIFDASNQNISTSRINLGIDSDGRCEFLCSESDKYIAFVKENGLWLMSIGENIVRQLFAFDTTEDFDIRDANDNNRIRVVSVDDKGNVEFLVYGYMNRGEHEGMTGAALYRYDIEQNIVMERIFIPFTKPYQILKETVGKLAYVNKNNIMYMMLNDSIYSIDLTGSEYVQIISDLKNGNYAVNSDGNLVAWQADNMQGAGKVIKSLNLETGEEIVINAEEGKRIKVIGFVYDDLAYGIAEDNMVITDKNGTTTVYMSELKITDSEGKVLKSYLSSGYYYTSAGIKSNMINLTRVSYSAETDSFRPAPDYQVFGNEDEDTSAAALSFITTDLKKQELVLNFVTKVTSKDKLELKHPREISSAEANSLSIRELITTENKFYVYGYGSIAGIYDDVSEAIVRADELSGVVIDEQGNYAWARISRPSEYQVSNVQMQATAAEGDATSQLILCINSMLAANGINVDITSEVMSGKNAVDILNEKLPDNQAFDLSGCTLPEILYYVCNGQPVLAATENNGYVLVTGYNFYNAIMLNPVTGNSYKQGIEETEKMFTQAGNKFVGIK